ncbi:MAG: aminoacyl-histidine dipeptidase [Clostridia bacterium]|nr:aminoacyl-histidine dipeptidase [Clostridia bacterium]
MLTLESLKKERIFYYFTELCKIPHGSGDMQKINEYCVQFAKEHSLEYYTDDLFNVIIKKKASVGHEDHPAVILQGHLDMVCEKEPQVDIDFLNDPINVLTDGEFLFADHTTLGADNGIAVAMMLSILEDNSLEHPPIEAVFTTDEETGMYGALALDTSLLNARRLINIDSEEQGVLTAGCAGGITANTCVYLTSESVNNPCYEIKVGSLLGGHSGIDIDKNRLNANKVMAELLNSLEQDYNLVSISGGDKNNAIARNCSAVISCKTDPTAEIENIKATLKNETETPEITVCKTQSSSTAVSVADSKKIISFMCDAPNGVITYSQNIEGLVQTSLNMGVVRTEANTVKVVFALRSAKTSELEDLKNQLSALADKIKGNIEFEGAYPAWEYRENSPLRDTLCNIYESMYKTKMKVDVIHAGLECGLLSEKIDGLDAVSIGPDLYDVHTPKERLDIASARSTYEYLCKVLKNL